MKPRMFAAFVLVVSLAFLLTISTAAQRPGPLNQRHVAFGSHVSLSRSSPSGDLRPQSTKASMAIGQPGTSFRHVRTFGETLVPYLADDAHLFEPYGVAVDTVGNVYVTESMGQRMMKFAANGTFITSTGQAGVWIFDNNLAQPAYLAVDSAGNTWVVNQMACRVTKHDPSGAIVGQLGRTWEAGSDNDHFQWPQGIAFDSAGRIYIGDTGNHRVQIFDSAGVYSTTLGATGTCTTTVGQFCSPQGLAIDSSNRLYVADTGDNRV